MQKIAAAAPNLYVGWVFAMVMWVTNMFIWANAFNGAVTGWIASARETFAKELLVGAKDRVKDDRTMIEKLWGGDLETTYGIQKKYI